MPTSNFGQLCRALDQWDAYPGAMLVYVDIRQMRDINQWAQPSVGDEIIERVLKTMQEWVGPGGVAIRLWSDEFVAARAIDHGQTAIDDCRQLRDRLCAIHYPSSLGESELSVAIGLATVGQKRDWQRHLADAGDACQIAKRRGLNQIVVSRGHAQGGTSHRDAGAVLNFRRLRDDGRLVLHAQPIMDIRDKTPRLAKAEFLLRMRNRGGHTPLPAGTIDTLEHFGLTPELDAFVSRAILEWIENHPEVVSRLDGLTINLSAHSLGDQRFMQRLFDDVRSVRPPPGKLGFEITETAAIAQLEMAADIIEDFRSVGCTFSLDDFGSGLCSFGYLHSLPVTEVKIDGRFIRDIVDDPLALEIVRSIHHVARAAGKRTVAEFVDSGDKLAVLQRLGIDYAQGFFFSAAVPPERLADMMLGAPMRVA
ncbi:EAL domain-containing protein [Solimonas marina]|uniref:EAL domain-containing protein n=1 Tax=Solimonas marina TaxID=2714601 RepID=A0A969WFW3_9GAMM|nr:GGDEF domain-containing phosphodiesterase [Solimonas marina]NKF23970.1 EAL domain-containing protein [Solimonas marina]